MVIQMAMVNMAVNSNSTGPQDEITVDRSWSSSTGSPSDQATDVTDHPEISSLDAKKARKPANIMLRQQQLPAWQPMLTARSVIPFVLSIGLIFIPVGIALYLSAHDVIEHVINYTECERFDAGKYQNQTCASVNRTTFTGTCKCRMNFTVTVPMGGPVFMYYALDNFFQNHRRYVKSVDEYQLQGGFREYVAGAANPYSLCDPFSSPGNNSWVDGVAYAPCGSIANSLFNDTITLTFLDATGGPAKVGLLRRDIAWKSDRAVKFKNYQTQNGESLKDFFIRNNLRKPPYWQKEAWQLDEEFTENNGYQNEDLIVWMRTATFPSFRKMYRRIDHESGSFKNGLPNGTYLLEIDYNYPVTAFGGHKYVILSPVSWLGGRNIFLGVAYIVVGCICALVAAILQAIHMQWGKPKSVMMDITEDTPFLAF